MTRPTTVAAFLEAHPLPWRAAEVNSLTGPEWDVLDATGHPVPNHRGIHYVREWAMVFAELGNEVGRLREAVEGERRQAQRWLGASRAVTDGTMDELGAAVAENGRLRVALRDAINRPLGVVPASAEEFYRADTAAPAAQQEGSRMASYTSGPISDGGMDPRDRREYVLCVEGDAPIVYDTPERAVAEGTLRVYLDSARVQDQIRCLQAGMIAEWGYGFAGLQIIPRTPEATDE